MKRVVMKTKTVTRTAERILSSTTLDVDTTDTENTSDSKLGILTLRWRLNEPYQRSATREANLRNKQ
jgi:hypothetical protein